MESWSCSGPTNTARKAGITYHFCTFSSPPVGHERRTAIGLSHVEQSTFREREDSFPEMSSAVPTPGYTGVAFGASVGIDIGVIDDAVRLSVTIAQERVIAGRSAGHASTRVRRSTAQRPLDVLAARLRRSLLDRISDPSEANSNGE